MKLSPRWFQYSLRSLLVLTTALAVWLGIVVNRAREQREAVKAIKAMGGTVLYDWLKGDPFAEADDPPAWLLAIFGEEFFEHPREVKFGEPFYPTGVELSEALPFLRRMRTLEEIRIFSRSKSSSKDLDELRSALPDCDVQVFFVPDSLRRRW